MNVRTIRAPQFHNGRGQGMMRIPQLTSLQGLSALSPSREQELRAIGTQLAEGFAEGTIVTPQDLAARLRKFSFEERQVIVGAFASETLETELVEASLGILAKEAKKKKMIIAGAVVGVGVVGYFLLR